MTDQPRITLIPLKPAVASNRATTLDLVVKIEPPDVEVSAERPSLNLGLVLDRSGSMSGSKLTYAKQAACYAVEQLQPTDRISVTVFDNNVDILQPSTLAEDKGVIVRRIQEVQPGGTTALHEGWVQGGMQVSEQLDSRRLNRVLLLSDGLANVGETNPDIIASHVKGLSTRGVSTSTIGLGDDYDEDLLAGMSTSGDGNFYHIESPDQLPSIFASELRGLMATVGNKVSLGLRPKSGVTIKEVFNDLDKTERGNLMLANLIAGSPVYVVLRLKIPAQQPNAELCSFRLAWNDPQSSQRREMRSSLMLPVLPYAEVEQMPANEEVQRQVALFQAARAREEAIQQMDRGDFATASQTLFEARSAIASAPASAMMAEEIEQLTDLASDLEAGKGKRSRKKARFQSLSRKRSRSD
ncbi:MAG: VWA domain-containing protein [Synechococcus sp.]